MLVRVVNVETTVTRICVERMGEVHDCEDDLQHVNGGMVMQVDVKPAVRDARDREEWALAPGRLFTLVPWIGEVGDGEVRAH